MNGRNGFTWAVVCLLAQVCASSAFAQATQAANDDVIEVRVEGNKNLTAGAVLAYAKTRVGQKYEQGLLKSDQQRMLQSGYFESVSASVNQTDKGVIVTFLVVERPKVAKIVFEGAKAFKPGDLLKELPFNVNGPLNRFNIETGRQAIQRKYRDGGYYYAEVTVDESAISDRQVVYRIVEGPKVTISKITFVGNTYFNILKLKISVSTSARFWPFIDGYLDAEQVQRDVDTLRNMYVEEGFLDAEVDARPMFSADKTKVTLEFRIVQGPRYRINEVVVRGNTIYRNDEIIRRLLLKREAFFTALSLRRDVKTVQDMYGEIGFIDAHVEARKTFIGPTTTAPEWADRLGDGQPALVNLVIDITENDQYTVGKIDIRGNYNTQSRIIRRELRFFPEQLFNSVAIEESRNRLKETRLFDDVTITPSQKGDKVRDVMVQVKEANTGQFLVGAGISSRDGLIGNITFTQRNFDLFAWPNTSRPFWSGEAFKGAGQTFSVVAEPGLEVMRFHIDWTEPYLFDKPYTLSNRIYVFERERETYDETRVGDILSVGRRYPNNWYGEIAQRIEAVDISRLDSNAPPEVIDDKGWHFVPSTKVTAVRDTTDNRWMPSAGDRLTLSYEQFYGQYTFGRVMGDYEIYRTVYKDALDRKHIWSGKIGAGQIIGDAPVFETFYGGGLGSIRGFKYRGISPRSEGTDQPIGGKFMFTANTEYTYPILGEFLRGDFFIDSGTVTSSTGLTPYRVAAGFGFQLIIPMFGPVPFSFDLGFPLMKDKDDDTQIFSFSVGMTF